MKKNISSGPGKRIFTSGSPPSAYSQRHPVKMIAIMKTANGISLFISLTIRDYHRDVAMMQSDSIYMQRSELRGNWLLIAHDVQTWAFFRT